MGNWLGAEESDYESPGCVVPNQIVVKLQYSHKFGDVSESNLQTLLDALSKTDSGYQWTLSAPIQASTPTLHSLKSTQHANDSSDVVTSTNQFCVTKPVPNNLTRWPYGVTKSTDTILIEWWLSGASVTSSAADLKTLDENVKGTVSKWVMNELNYLKHVWIVSRYTVSQPTTTKHPIFSTVEKVTGYGYGNA